MDPHPIPRKSRGLGAPTRRDSNPHLRLGQSAVLPLHHGPYGQFQQVQDTKARLGITVCLVMAPNREGLQRDDPMPALSLAAADLCAKDGAPLDLCGMLVLKAQNSLYARPAIRLPAPSLQHLRFV